MKNTLIILFITITFNIAGQCTSTVSATYTAPSCSTCCDGIISGNPTGSGLCAPFGFTLQPLGIISPTGSWSNLCVGSYTVQFKDGGCCLPATCSVILTAGSTKISESVSDVALFKLFPNPSSNTLFISNDKNLEPDTEIEITNTLGQTVLKLMFKNEINVSQLSSGYYTLKIITKEKYQFHSKFIKE